MQWYVDGWTAHNIRWTSCAFETPEGRFPLVWPEAFVFPFGDAVAWAFLEGPAFPSPSLDRGRGSETTLRPFPVFGGMAIIAHLVIRGFYAGVLRKDGGDSERLVSGGRNMIDRLRVFDPIVRIDAPRARNETGEFYVGVPSDKGRRRRDSSLF